MMFLFEKHGETGDANGVKRIVLMIITAGLTLATLGLGAKYMGLGGNLASQDGAAAAAERPTECTGCQMTHYNDRQEILLLPFDDSTMSTKPMCKYCTGKLERVRETEHFLKGYNLPKITYDTKSLKAEAENEMLKEGSKELHFFPGWIKNEPDMWRIFVRCKTHWESLKKWDPEQKRWKLCHNPQRMYCPYYQSRKPNDKSDRWFNLQPEYDFDALKGVFVGPDGLEATRENTGGDERKYIEALARDEPKPEPGARRRMARLLRWSGSFEQN